ncbi:MAG: hypothetical protein GTO45_38750 [Candidatus Aminicenantes bacterium]|nr:hypothetical protein [Candidatus Aminicenantes bacterium]NIM84565.1 hypothetical protein [Candidatus Aminicenantes bacterium]NIN24085.1 hypothetical protein [Candidatus Aminicenantes bacterium]NIN47791.1 hypothetical protein [Candidatus Aminicenantes bacterium]NIN90729.1 hypothetical protein [Candidatus Aminicenantes bacterium]
MNKRPEIEKITITLEFKGGGSKEKVIDVKNPSEDLPEAVFFGNKGVKKILPIFYVFEDKDVEMSRDEVEEKWGKKVAKKIFGDKAEPAKKPAEKEEKKPIDKKFIRDIWDTPGDDGKLPVMLLKKPRCPLE